MGSSDPYQRVAGVYDRVIEPMQAGVRRVAFEVLPPEPGWRVLDVGCGTGTGLVPYVKAGCKTYGVDVSSAMLHQARERLGDTAELHLADGDALPFGDAGFDLVMSSMVLHEIAAPDRAAFLAEMARVCVAGGRLQLVDFRFGSLRGWRGRVTHLVSEIIERFSGHHDRYRSFKASGGVEAPLAEAGLEIEREKVVAGGTIAIYVVPVAD